MPESQDRKPPAPTTRKPAQEALNTFLAENNMLIGNDRPEIDFTNNGRVIVGQGKIIAVYADEVGAPPQPSPIAN
jgi:hypothetical protein